MSPIICSSSCRPDRNGARDWLLWSLGDITSVDESHFDVVLVIHVVALDQPHIPFLIAVWLQARLLQSLDDRAGQGVRQRPPACSHFAVIGKAHGSSPAFVHNVLSGFHDDKDPISTLEIAGLHVRPANTHGYDCFQNPRFDSCSVSRRDLHRLRIWPAFQRTELGAGRLDAAGSPPCPAQNPAWLGAIYDSTNSGSVRDRRGGRVESSLIHREPRTMTICQLKMSLTIRLATGRACDLCIQSSR